MEMEDRRRAARKRMLTLSTIHWMKEERRNLILKGRPLPKLRGRGKPLPHT